MARPSSGKGEIAALIVKHKQKETEIEDSNHFLKKWEEQHFQIAYKEMAGQPGFVWANHHFNVSEFEKVCFLQASKVTREKADISRQWLEDVGFSASGGPLFKEWDSMISTVLREDERGLAAYYTYNLERKDPKLIRFFQFDEIKLEDGQRKKDFMVWMPGEEMKIYDIAKPFFHAIPASSDHMLYGQLTPENFNKYSSVFAKELIPKNCKASQIGAFYHALRSGQMGSAKAGDQASHTRIGYIGMRRACSPGETVLEQCNINQGRKACADAWKVSVGDGNGSDGKEEIKSINASLCSHLHPNYPCQIWDEEWGGIPAIVKQPLFTTGQLLMRMPKPNPSEFSITGMKRPFEEDAKVAGLYKCLDKANAEADVENRIHDRLRDEAKAKFGYKVKPKDKLLSDEANAKYREIGRHQKRASNASNAVRKIQKELDDAISQCKIKGTSEG